MWQFLLTHTPLSYMTQSLWRDEVFSIFYAKQSIEFILTKSSMEPPIHYLLLHFWIKIFGTSEIATRSLSLLGFTLATIVVIEWSDKLFKKHWLSWFTPLIFFLNPMLLYYAFEVRTYGWYIFFSICAIVFYKEKKWKLFVISSILGLYTHLYFLVLLFAQSFHYFFTDFKYTKHKKIINDPMVVSLEIIGITFIPWVIRVYQTLGKITNSWYYPVDFRLIQSVLGNIFVGFEGTPDFLWTYTKILSIILLIIFCIPLLNKKTKEHGLYFSILIFIPLIAIIGISFIKPLFVNRYLIFVTVAEIFLISFSLYTMQSKPIQKIFGSIILIFLLFFNCWYPPLHPKKDFRTVLTEVNKIKKPNDMIFAEDALIFWETYYYAKDKASVRLYNPEGKPFPWYVGDAIFLPSYIAPILPTLPVRAFIIKQDTTFSVSYRTMIKSQ